MWSEMQAFYTLFCISLLLLKYTIVFPFRLNFSTLVKKLSDKRHKFGESPRINWLNFVTFLVFFSPSGYPVYKSR